MRNRIVLFALLFLLSLFGKKAFAREEGRLFSNFIFEETIDEAQCDQLQMEVSALDSMTSVDTIPKIVGHWVSQSCEVRPGSEFVLRSYTFTESNSFRLLQHYYEDENCVSPLYSVVAKGKLTFKEPYWVTRIGMESEFFLSKVTIIPHVSEYIEKLSSEVKHKCSDGGRKMWKPHKEYVIYAKFDEMKMRRKLKKSRSKRKKIHGHIDCLNAVKLNFGELMLIRAQTKIVDESKTIRELFLGDIPYRWETYHKPTAFQPPMLLSEEVPECFNCQLVAKGTEWSPPRLPSKPHLPPLPDGQWISQRCEVRPVGIFLTRKFSFDSRDYSWAGDYKFFEDPFCTEPTFSISASGKYEIGSDQEKENFGKRKIGTNFDITTREAFLTIYDPILRDIFNVETNCGVGPWQLGVAKDLSTTSGCLILDITLPSTDYDLIKMELDNKGTPMLLLGLQDSELKNGSHINHRPTAFQAPLIQCSVFPHQDPVNNQFAPISYFKITSRSPSLLFSFPALCTMPLFILFFSYFFCKKL